MLFRSRRYYLREISETVRSYHKHAAEQTEIARRLFQLQGAMEAVRERVANSEVLSSLETLKQECEQKLSPESKKILNSWETLKEKYSAEKFVTSIRGKEIVTQLRTKSLSGLSIPKVALPRYKDYGEILRWVYLENVPGSFPYTAGVFPDRKSTRLNSSH